ncbi:MULTISPECIES: DNA-3-methyladenine glycosylase I [unclassified Bacillus cereus group]|uniref:DNA-3-methyladenine glycosylase I n=1 Tax=unclassified Bacillus cereus group TaxID=2750818 RepID=UPI001F567F59|nr:MULTISPECIES: DNA-3-methyladenine glycosylase I [unclassified Bacillus cereus group]
MQRCDWQSLKDSLYRNYHDNEWGYPTMDSNRLFEMLNLEGQQAGLSWSTILKRRITYNQAFDNFDPIKIIRYDEKKILKLLKDEGIIRYRLKIESIIKNSHAYINMLEKGEDFSNFIWGFVDGRPIHNEWKSINEVPTETKISTKMSKELKDRGFTFVGSTTCYAYMQAVGLVNDHLLKCFCYEKIKNITIS